MTLAGVTELMIKGFGSPATAESPGTQWWGISLYFGGQAALAQLVERLTRNEKVESSILSGGSRNPDG